MRKQWKAWMILAVFALLCGIPQQIFAADKSKDWEYDFNENKTVEIIAKRSYLESEKYTWLKYKPAADGYLTVKISKPDASEEPAKGYLALYDGTKTKLLSSSSIFYNTAHTDKSFWHEFAFGMQKGKEYYIRVRAENAAELGRKFTKVKDTSGSSRAKAAALKKNKAKTGLIAAGVSAADWYQFSLSKKQRIRLNYSAKTNGSFKISVYWGTKLMASWNMYYTSGQKRTLYLKNDLNKKKMGMNTGKYYIKIERANATSSGFYKIKWN